MHRLFADVPPRFPKPREKQFLVTVIVSRLTKLAGKEKPGQGDCLPYPGKRQAATQDAGSSGGAGYTSISGQYQVGQGPGEGSPRG